MALALEGVRRQAQPATVGSGEAIEVDRHPGDPLPGERGQRVRRVGCRVVRVAQGRDRGDGSDRLAAGVRRQRLAGPELDGDHRTHRQHRGQVVVEADRAAEVVDPRLRIGGLLGGDETTGQVRQVRHRRRREVDRGDDLAELVEDRVEHRAVPGGDELQPRRRHLLGLELRGEVVDHVGRTADDALVGGVDDRQRQPLRQEGAHIVLGQRHGEHAGVGATGPADQAAAADDERQRVLEGHDPGEVGGDVLAEAVAEQHVGLHAPRHPLPRQGHRGDEHRRQRCLDLAQCVAVAVGGEQRREVGPAEAEDLGGAVAHDVVEHVEAAVQPGAHPGVLRAAAGEHEGDTRRLQRRRPAGRPPLVLRPQLGDRALDVGCRHDPPVRHRPPSGDERVGDVGELDVRVGLEERRQSLAGLGDRGRRPPGQAQHLLGQARLARCRLGRLLEDGVGVGAADAQRADAGAARRRPPSTPSRCWRS